MPTLKRGAADSQRRLGDARQFSRVRLQSWTNVRGRPKCTKVGSRQTNGGRRGVLSSCSEHPKWASPNLGHSCRSETKSYQIRALVDLSLFTIALRIGISSEDKGKYCLWRRRGVFFPGTRLAVGSFPHQNNSAHFTDMKVKTSTCGTSAPSVITLMIQFHSI